MCTHSALYVHVRGRPLHQKETNKQTNSTPHKPLNFANCTAKPNSKCQLPYSQNLLKGNVKCKGRKYRAKGSQEFFKVPSPQDT